MRSNHIGVNHIIEGLEKNRETLIDEARKGAKVYAVTRGEVFQDRLDWVLAEEFPNTSAGWVSHRESFTGDKGICELVLCGDTEHEEFWNYIKGFGFKEYDHRDNKHPDTIQWYILKDRFAIATFIKDVAKRSGKLKGVVAYKEDDQGVEIE